MTLELTKPLKLFYCYSREDILLREELDKHLENLKRLQQITSWNDRDINAGNEWEHDISTSLSSADIILLLISPDFMHSDYCYGVEMKLAMSRHEAGEAKVIPVILRPVDWEDSPFSKLQVLPTDGNPVTSWLNHDEAFWDVAAVPC